MKLVRLSENFEIDLSNASINSEQVLQEAKDGKKIALRIRIEAIHEMITKNNIMYTAERLRGDSSFVSEGKIRPSGAYSWNKPYPKPMLKNHDPYTEPLGRIVEAKYVEKTTAGVPGIEVVAEISDPDAIAKVEDGRYYTVSIGADTDALYCSICNQNILEEGHCDHWKGEVYEGQKAYWRVGNLWFSELSFVNMPADENARVIDPGVLDKAKSKESTDSDQIFIIDETKKVIRLLTESDTTTGKEADNLENQELEKQQQEDNQDTGAAENIQSEGETQESLEELQSKVTSLQQDLKERTSQFNAVMESLLNIIKESGIDLDSTHSEENEEGTSAEESEADQRVAELEAEVEELRQANTQLQEMATRLQGEVRENLVEQIVNLRIELGRSLAEDRDSEIEAYQSRSEESLRDSLEDLLREKDISSKKTNVRETQKVDNPSLVDNNEKKVIELLDKDSDQKKQTKPLSDLDVLKSLFRGRQ